MYDCSPSGSYAARASSKSCTPAIMSMIGLAAIPGIAVEPMWWMPPFSHGASTCPSSARSASKRRGHSRSYRTTAISSSNTGRRLSGGRNSHQVGCDRQLEGEGRASSLLGGDPDPPVHLPDELVTDVQAETSAHDTAGQERIKPMELLEDARLLLGGNAQSLISDQET